MSTAEIIAELPRLTHQERRDLTRRLIEIEEDSQVLADCDRRADENFLVLDAMEDEDARRNQTRRDMAR